MGKIRQVPPPCKPGDKVAIVAPSGVFRKEFLEQGLELLRSWGLKPTFQEDIFDRWGYLAGEDSTRARILMQAFQQKEVTAVLCARGGYGASRLQELLDWEILRQNPKRFLGFSDITSLHLGFYKHTGFQTFHGPMIASQQFFEGTDASQNSVRQALFGTPKELCKNIRGKTLFSGKASGFLVGGNLSLVISSLSTSWEPNWKNSILFLEDVSEPPYRIDRMFQQLKQAGVLDKINGLLIGDVGQLKDQYTTYQAAEFWKERIGLPAHIPTLYELPVGHIANNHAIPVGTFVSLNCGESDGYVLERSNLLL